MAVTFSLAFSLLVLPTLFCFGPRPLAADPPVARPTRRVPAPTLGIVILDGVPLRAAAAKGGKVLTLCRKGQWMAVTQTTGDSYGILMIDRSVGYISKAAVRLTGEQMTNIERPIPKRGTLGQKLRQTGFRFLGTRGGRADGAGLIRTTFRASGIPLPSRAAEQAAIGFEVPRADPTQWQIGDRLYFVFRHRRIDHTGLYIGDGRFLHVSARRGRQVGVDNIAENYFAKHLVAVRRSQKLLLDAL